MRMMGLRLDRVQPAIVKVTDKGEVVLGEFFITGDGYDFYDVADDVTLFNLKQKERYNSLISQGFQELRLHNITDEDSNAE